MPFRPPTYKEKEQWNIKTCAHPEHDPPTMVSLKPGLYIWVCPACGAETHIFVHRETN